MPLKVVLALLLLVGLGERCDIPWTAVVSWNITVTNAGPGDAIVGISGWDVHLRAVVPAGESATITSFTKGGVLISATPTAGVLAQMMARRDQIAAKLDAKPIDSATSIEIYNQLGQLDAEIRAYESEQSDIGSGSQCVMQLETDKDGHGINVSARAFFDDSRFKLAC